MDDDTLFIIEESNVLETSNEITIHDEKLRDDSVLMLNKDQIINELTNLLVHKHKQVEKKINVYLNMFFPKDKFQEDFSITTLKPILYYKKYVIVHDDKQDKYSNIDQEFQDIKFIQPQKFKSFIDQFNTLNKDKSNQYLQDVNVLYSLYKPFLNLDNISENLIKERTIIDSNIDSYRHFIFSDDDSLFEEKYSITRLIGPLTIDTGKRPEQADDKPGCTSGLHYITSSSEQTIYDGDKIDIVGYIHEGINHEGTSGIFKFNLNTYIKNLEALKKGTKVIIKFNDFAFDKTGKVIFDIDGSVIDNDGVFIHVKPSTIISFIDSSDSDKMFKIPIKEPSKCFVYEKVYEKNTSDFMFHKPMLRSNNKIVFYLLKSDTPIKSTLNYIKPTSLSELFYMYFDLFPSFQTLDNLRKFLLDQDINYDNLPTELFRILNLIFNQDKHLYKSLSVTKPSYHIHNYQEGLNDFILNFKTNLINLEVYKQEYIGFKTFIDISLNRYAHLRNKNDYGYLYILSIVKEQLENKFKNIEKSREKFENQLLELKQQLNNIRNDIEEPVKKTSAPNITKKYYVLSDLENDNDKDIIYDKDIDPTPYKILEDIPNYQKLSREELKFVIIDKLVKNTKKNYSTMPQDKLNFEVKCIIHGKRPVKIGDHAILYFEDGSSALYIRKIIRNSNNWIKILKAPFQICSDNLSSIDDISASNNVNLLDPFDSLCRKAKSIRANILYQNILQQITLLESIISFLDKYEDIKNEIDNDINHYIQQLKLIQTDSLFSLEKLRRIIQIKIPHLHIEENEYEDYLGDSDLLDLDKIFNNIEYTDTGFGYMHQFIDKKYHGDTQQKSIDNDDILQTFIDLMDISEDITQEVKEYILNTVNITYPKKNVLITIAQEEEKLRKNIKKDLYDTNQDYRLKVENLIKEKIKSFETNVLKKYYYNLILELAAVLNITIIAKYPSITIRKIIPKCVKHFSYIGYPILKNDNQMQSLTKYIACIISSIGIPDDLRFNQFSSMNINEIDGTLRENIDKILENNFQLAGALEEGAKMLAKVKPIITKDLSDYTTLNVTFKPNFNFDKTSITTLNKDDATIIDFIKNINDYIKKSKFLKQNAFNNPFIVNSCCLDQLSHTSNFYDMFKDNLQIKNIITKINDLNQNIPKTFSYIPLSKTSIIKYMFQDKPITINLPNVLGEYQEQPIISNDAVDKLTLFLNDNELFMQDDILSIIDEKLEDDVWWDDVFFPEINNRYKQVVDIIRKYYDKIDIEKVEKLKAIIVDMNTNFGQEGSKKTVSDKYTKNLNNLKTSFNSFIKFQFASSLSKIIHKKFIEESTVQSIYPEELSETIIIEALLNNDSYNNILEKISKVLQKTLKNSKNLFFNTNDDDEIIIKNIAILTYVYLKVLYNILYVTICDDFDFKDVTFNANLTSLKTNNKNHMILSSMIVLFMMNKLYNYLILNDNDNDKIKMKVEELREKKKQAMISVYSADDEARRLQIMLKKMGLSDIVDPDSLNKEDIKEKEKQIIPIDTDILKNDNKLQEEQNYYIGDFKGENADDVEIEEEYFANPE